MKIHPSAVIHPSAEIDDGAEIGPFCYIGPKVKIGKGTRLLHGASVMGCSTIGEDNLLHPGSIIGGEPQDKKFQGEETWVHIGDRNIFREHVTINRGTEFGGGATRLGDDCLLMAGCHIAHDCILGNGVTMASAVLLGGHVVVEDHVGFGGMCAVHHFTSIGRFAFIGGMTRVFSDAPPFMITEGHPSRVRGLNRVGLRRNGISEETVAWLKEAFRAIFHDKGMKEEAMQRLRDDGSVPPEGEVLLDFVGRAIKGKQGRALQP